MVYYVCRVVEFPLTGKNGPTELSLEIVDCKVPTLNPNIFNKAFSNREMAEDYIKSQSSGVFVVVYEPKK